MAAHPPFLLGWHTNNKTIVRNILRYHSACCHERESPERRATDDGGVRPDAGAPPNGRVLVECVPFDLAPGIGNIGQRAGRAKENIVLDHGAAINADIVLHFHIAPQLDTRTEHNILAEVAIFSNFRTSHDMTEVPDFGALTYFCRRVDDGGGVGEESGG